MSFDVSQVVGLIELDRPGVSTLEPPPLRAARSRPAASQITHLVAASDDDVITADLRQLKRELRAELACIIARLRRAARS